MKKEVIIVAKKMTQYLIVVKKSIWLVGLSGQDSYRRRQGQGF